MVNLWLALHKNISVCTLNYSRLNFFAILEMKAIDAEMALNDIIRQRIIPHRDTHPLPSMFVYSDSDTPLVRVTL